MDYKKQWPFLEKMPNLEIGKFNLQKYRTEIISTQSILKSFNKYDMSPSLDDLFKRRRGRW